MRQRIPQNGTNFGMIANYGELKGKATSTTTGVTKQLEGRPAEAEAKKLRVQPSDPKETTGEEEKTLATQTTSVQE
jgi:hypothetical protein